MGSSGGGLECSGVRREEGLSRCPYVGGRDKDQEKQGGGDPWEPGGHGEEQVKRLKGLEGSLEGKRSVGAHVWLLCSSLSVSELCVLPRRHCARHLLCVTLDARREGRWGDRMLGLPQRAGQVRSPG